MSPRSLSIAIMLGTTMLGGVATAGTPKYGPWGVDYTSMDKSVNPGDDFFGYAEGSWLKNTPIAPDKASAGYNSDLPDEAELDVRQIVEDLQKAPSTPMARQIADFYAAWMDESGIEPRGTAPLKPYLARIDAVTNRDELVKLMVDPSYASPIDMELGPDDKDPTRYIVAVSQARLGLPTRDYYLLSGAKYDAIRKAYRDYIIRIQELAGIPDAAAKADRIIALETRLSQDQWTPERRRDPQATYNPMTRAQLDKLAPEFNWTPTLAHAGLGTMTTVVVAEPSAVQAAARLTSELPLQTWKDYLTFRFISDHAQYLPKAFDDARFGFYSHTLRDVAQQSERWKRGVRLLDGNLGEAVGQLYVEKRWSAETSRQMTELLADLHAAYAEKINHASWMDEATRQAALKKLATFDPRVGHPVKYIDYSSMKVSATDPLANAVESDRFEWRLQLSRMHKPVDRSLWGMTPQTVNAYYQPTMNQVTFPAAFLQPPFFDPNADPAVNYGETGAAIGHEMGHGFDDEGRQYNEKGQLKDWWTKEAAARYTAHAQKLVAQFNGYEPIPGVHIKGQPRSARTSPIWAGWKRPMPPIAAMLRGTANRR